MLSANPSLICLSYPSAWSVDVNSDDTILGNIVLKNGCSAPPHFIYSWLFWKYGEHCQLIETVQLKNIQPMQKFKLYEITALSILPTISAEKSVSEINMVLPTVVCIMKMLLFYWQSFANILLFQQSAFGRLGTKFCVEHFLE